jgi:hypothetical protein
VKRSAGSSASAPAQALALSCADKTANMLDMLRHMKEGHSVDSFTSKDHSTQLAKFVALAHTFRGRVPEALYTHYEVALDEFRHSGTDR